MKGLAKWQDESNFTPTAKSQRDNEDGVGYDSDNDDFIAEHVRLRRRRDNAIAGAQKGLMGVVGAIARGYAPGDVLGELSDPDLEKFRKLAYRRRLVTIQTPGGGTAQHEEFANPETWRQQADIEFANRFPPPAPVVNVAPPDTAAIATAVSLGVRHAFADALTHWNAEQLGGKTDQ